MDKEPTNKISTIIEDPKKPRMDQGPFLDPFHLTNPCCCCCGVVSIQNGVKTVATVEMVSKKIEDQALPSYVHLNGSGPSPL
ncbi:unnamed protein product [Orchesella dallaii]|uniref:Uncharacterized protein n=1 Tax=Orchesella dallaii TaxID=48710 RepID=A0ABP1S6W2_9HEXA